MSKNGRKMFMLCLSIITIVAMASSVLVTAEKITLRFMSGYTATQAAVYNAYQELIKEYERLNPNVAIEDLGAGISGEQLLLKMMSAEPPDIVKTDMPTIVSLMKKGALESAPTQLAAALNRSFYPVAVQAMTMNGKIMGVPVESSITGLIYNKRLFAEAGMSKPPASWDELDVIGPKLTRYDGSKVVTPAITETGNWSLDYFAIATIFGEGGRLVDDKGAAAITESPVYAALDRWVNAIARKRYLVLGQTTPFVRGQVPMHFAWPYYMSTLKTNGTLDQMATAPLPKGTANSTAIYRNHGYAVPTTAQHKAEAWKFLEWLGTQELADGGTGLGRINSALGSLPMQRNDINASYYLPIRDFMNGFVQASLNAIPNVAYLSLGIITTTSLSDAIKQVALNGISPQQALTAAATAIQTQIADWNK